MAHFERWSETQLRNAAREQTTPKGKRRLIEIELGWRQHRADMKAQAIAEEAQSDA